MSSLGQEEKVNWGERLPETVSLFPLSGVLLLPGSRLPLIIFEPRYLEMVRDALEGDRKVGVVQPIEPAADPVPEGVAVFAIGCLGHIATSAETDDGRMLITVGGVSRFCIDQEIERRNGYRRARVRYDLFPDDVGGEPRQPTDHVRLLRAVRSYLDMAASGTDWDAIEKASDATLINLLAMVGPFQPREKQALLECRDIGERGAMVISLMEMAAHGGGTAGAGVN